MASSPDAPKQQNPTIAAQQSALSNLQFSNAALTANRINSKNQNGEVRYVSSENFDQAAYNRAMADWQASRNIIGMSDTPMPTKNEFYTKTWTQSEELNPALKEALTNQQLGNKVLSGSLQTLANKAKSSLNTTYNGPKLGDYTKGMPSFDQTKIAQVSPVQSNTQLKSNLGTLPGINTSASTKLDKTKLDTDVTNNLKSAGTVKDSTAKAGSFVSGAKSLDQTVNTSGVGGVNNFGSSSKIDTNLADDQRNVGGVNNFGSSAKIDTNLADDMRNVGLVNDFSQRAGQFQTSANKVNQNFSSNGTKLDTNINDNFSGVKNLNQDGVKQVGQFTNNAGNVVSSVKNANIDTNISDNLKAAGVNTNQQTFNVGGSNVKTNVPQFDPNAAGVYQKAAYDAQNVWLAPQMEAQRKAEANRLALQGLGVDSEASKGAMSAVYDSQNRAAQALAASSYASGAEQARQNYQTSLAGVSQANDAEAQRYAQELQKFNTNLSAQNQAFNQQNTIFNQNNAANQQVFDNSLTQAQLNNSAQNQKFNQQNQTFANNLDAAKTNQSIINDSNAARSAAFNQSLQKFNAQNDARSQQFAQDQSAFNTNNAAQNQQFAQDQSRFNNSLASLNANADIAKMNNDFQNQRNAQAMNAFNANNQAQKDLFAQDQARAQLNADLQNQRFNQSLQNFNTLNQANKDLFAQDQARATTNADLQNQRYTQALNTFNAQNAARGQQFAQSDAAFKNNLSALNFNADQIAQNNDAQNQRFAQALSAFNTQNQALKDQAAINANRVTTNADLQAMDNAAAMQKQNWALQNANFYNQSQLAQNNIAQQNFQNRLQAQAANLDLRNANNSNRQQYLADALSRFQADNQYQLDNRYRALNEYNSLLAGTTPVSANSQYQNFAQQGQTGGVDYAGAAQQANASAMARYQAGVNQANATNQGLASLAGTVAMYAAMSSDKNLKTNIQQTGETASGRKTYSWDWNKKANELGLEGKSEGVLAQENKDIAFKDPVTGYLAVDYSKLNTKKKKV